MYLIFSVLLLIIGVAVIIFSFKFEPSRDDIRYGGEPKRNYQLLVGLGITGLAALMLVFALMTIIPAGHVGVLTLFGKVYGQVPEGIHMVNPLSAVTKMSVRSQQLYDVQEAPSQEGLNMHIETSVIYKLDPQMAAKIYKEIGPNYVDVIVIPEVRSAIRGATVKHNAKDLYTSDREAVANDIYAIVSPSLKARGVITEQVLLRKVQLPESVAQAINSKLEADQEAQRMQFVLAKEKQEAERKRIEARGIADFQKIVTEGISEPLLRWKGIEATEMLAKSDNSKMVIIGGRDGLPLILNTK